jgi:hypothetical protein
MRVLGVSEMAPRKLCLFCDNPSDGKSKEDVLPVWIQEKMKGKRRLVVNGFSGERPIVGQAVKPSVKTGCVCRECNNGWMSRLEGEARKILGPLMEDIHLMLDGNQTFTIAKWAVKTAMTTAAMNRKERSPFYSRDECSRFRESVKFPPHTQVWLGRYEGSADGGIFGIDGWDNDPKHPEVTHFYITTLLFKRVLIQVLSVHVRDYQPGSRLSLPLYDGPWEQSLLDLATHANLFWPPPLSFSDSGDLSLQRLVYRFNVHARPFNPFRPDE